MPGWEQHLCIVAFEKPKAWRLMEVNKEGTVSDWEFVFTIQGAIDATDLPPYTGTLLRDPSKWLVPFDLHRLMTECKEWN